MSRQEVPVRSSTITISTLSFVKALIIIATVGFLFLIRDVLAVLFVALIFASALSPWVGSLERRGVPRPLGILMIYLSIVSLFALTITLLIPPIASEYTQIAARFPEYSDKVIGGINAYYPELNVIEQFKAFAKSIQSILLQTAGDVVGKIFDVIKGFFAFFLIFVVTFYMIIEENVIRKAIHSVTPQRVQPYIDELISKIQNKIGLWLRAQITLSFIIFSLSLIGLTILGVDYALLLALVAGLTEFLPVIGPIIGGIPAVFIAFNQSPWLALWVLCLYVLIQRMENDFLVPRVMQKAVGINPVVSIIAILIGGKIGGLLGVVLAIPVATVISTIIFDFLEHEEERAPHHADS